MGFEIWIGISEEGENIFLSPVIQSDPGEGYDWNFFTPFIVESVHYKTTSTTYVVEIQNI